MLYFTNTDMVTIDSTIFSWHKIEMIGLDGKNHKAIVTDVEKPRGLFVDTKKK